MHSDFVFLLLKLTLIPYAIAVVMPNWRWLAGITVVIGGTLAALWIYDWILTSDPLHHEGAGDGLGRVLAMLVTVGFATGVCVRGVSLIPQARGVRLRYVTAICIAGFAIVPAIFYVPSAWHAWKHRPASLACANATFTVKVAEAKFALPAAMFVVYLGRTVRRDAYYLEFESSLREFCGLNDNGKRPVVATQIWLGSRNVGRATRPLCASPVAEWARTYCEARDVATRGKEDDFDFPLDIHVFAVDQVIPGEFGGSRSTYEDSLRAQSQPTGHLFIASDVMVSDHPLTFDCTPMTNSYWCKTFYPWRDGTTLGYTFRAAREDVAARGARIDAEARKFLAGLMPP